MNKTLRQIIVALLLITISGCSGSANTSANAGEAGFQTAVPIANMNKSLEINIDSDETTFRVGAEIPLTIQNQSNDYIFLTGDNYIKLFIIENTEWIEAKNELTYSGSKVLSPKGTPLLDLDRTSTQPAFDQNIFSDQRSEMLLRILVTGEIMENDVRTGKLVGAFVDVHIVP